MAIGNLTQFKKKHQILIETLDYNGIGVGVIDQNHKILYYSNCLGEIFGKPHRKKCYEHFLQRNAPCETCPMQRSIKNNKIEQEIIITPDNRIYKIISAPLLNDNGKLDRTLEVLIDITEEIEHKTRLQESEEKWRSMAKNSPDFIITLDKDERIIYINRSEVSGLGMDDLIGKSLSSFLPDNSKKLAKDCFKRVLESGQNDSYNSDFIYDDGTIHYIESRVGPVLDEGIVVGFTINSTDITERKQAEQKLKESEYKVGERVKELTCLYEVSKLVESLNYSLEEILQGTLDLIPPAWQFPEVTCAKISFHGQEFKTKNFMKTKWKLIAGIKRGDEIIGNIEVYYLKDKSLLDEGPFLKEERNLINALAEVLGRHYERKMVEQKLKNSEEKYRLLFENSPIGIGLSTFEDKVLDQNDAMGNLTGYTLEELNKIGILAVYDDPNEWLKLINLLKETGEVHDYEVKLRRKDNSEIRTSLSLDLIEFEGKKIIQSALRDVTKEKKAEHELTKLNNLKSELLTRTSHELKTPAMLIKGYTRLFLKKYSNTLGAEALTIINEIEKASLRLETLIHEILQGAEFESEKGEIYKNRYDLSFLIHSVVRELKIFAEFRGITVNLNIHENLIFQFDRDQIYHVINNILSNAIKYTEPHGIIKINSKITEDSIEIAIQDSGIGFIDEEKEMLFTQFGKIERYGQGFDVISEGIGLGLHIAKKIIDLHGGEIWVESEGKNRGSTFNFTLPKGE